MRTSHTNNDEEVSTLRGGLLNTAHIILCEKNRMITHNTTTTTIANVVDQLENPTFIYRARLEDSHRHQGAYHS